MLLVDQSINIKVPVDQVFAAVSDLSCHASWASESVALLPDGERQVEVGKKYTVKSPLLNYTHITVTELVPNVRLGYKVVITPKLLDRLLLMRFTGWEIDCTFTFASQGAETLVSRQVDCVKAPWPLMRPLLPLVKWVSQRDRRLLNRMKRDLEGSGE